MARKAKKQPEMGAALNPGNNPAQANPSGVENDLLMAVGSTSMADGYFDIPPEQICPYRNKKGEDFSKLSEEAYEALKESIRLNGQWDPVIVRKIPTDRSVPPTISYELLAGENRWNAIRELGGRKVRAFIIEANDEEAEAIFVGTNFFRRKMKLEDEVLSAKRYLQANPPLRERLANESGEKKPGERMLYRLASLDKLVPQLMNSVTHGGLTLIGGEYLSVIPKEEQNLMVQWGFVRLKEDQARAVRDYYYQVKKGDAEWTPQGLANCLQIQSEDTGPKTWTQAGRVMRQVAKEKVTPALIPYAEQLMTMLLDEFLAKHPDLVRVKGKKPTDEDRAKIAAMFASSPDTPPEDQDLPSEDDEESPSETPAAPSEEEDSEP